MVVPKLLGAILPFTLATNSRKTGRNEVRLYPQYGHVFALKLTSP